MEEQEAGLKRRRGGEDGHHIYESIQDLNLDLDALRRDIEGTLGKEVFMTASQKAIVQPPHTQVPSGTHRHRQYTVVHTDTDNTQ